MRGVLGGLVLSLLALVALAGPVLGHGGGEVQIIVADAACGETTHCLQLWAQPDHVDGAGPLALAFFNRESSTDAHPMCVTSGESAGVDSRNTSRDVAIACTEPIAPGMAERLFIDVPESRALYVWCPTADHEAQGMWLNITLPGEPPAQEPPQETNTQPDAPGSEPAGPQPAPTPLGIVSVLALTIAALTRRKR